MTLRYLIFRHTKLFFKDKGMFFPSLIAPIILLALFVTFLKNVYRQGVEAGIPKELNAPAELIDGFVGGWLLSAMLAVCCITVAFGANLIMVQDKMLGNKRDLTISPVSRSVLALSYYISTVLITAIICYFAMTCGLIYVYTAGWYFTTADVIKLVVDTGMMVLFGTALSSFILFFVKNQGGATAVVTIVSSTYGFLCGAYMPISSFSEGIQNFIKALPGTYGTVILHKDLMEPPLRELEGKYMTTEGVEMLRDAFDCNLYISGDKVSTSTMYLVICGAIAILVLGFILENKFKKRL